MNIIKTSIFLVSTLLLIVLCTYFLGTPLGAEEMNTLKTLFYIYLAVSMTCFTISELTNNYSQVDKIWSIVPIVYTIIIAYKGEFSIRLILMSILVLIWGTRLTYNFNRVGGYSIKFWEGKEDYRWAILRAKPEFKNKWKWRIFNFFFISVYQNMLLLLITMPAIIAFQYNENPVQILDFLAAGAMLFFIILETKADQQQWDFQTKKWDLINSGKELISPYKKGFIDYKLWGLSRHPNYFAEQSIWICFYLFSVAASGQWINWSAIGFILLILLFYGSSQFSEEISSSKYPAYKMYQSRVPRFIPFIFNKRK